MKYKKVIDSLQSGDWVVAARWHLVGQGRILVQCEEGALLFSWNSIKQKWDWWLYINYFMRGKAIMGSIKDSGDINDNTLRIGQLLS